MKERVISHQFNILDWFICMQFDHTFLCCIAVEDMNVFNVQIFCLKFFVVAYVRKQAGIK